MKTIFILSILLYSSIAHSQCLGASSGPASQFDAIYEHFKDRELDRFFYSEVSVVLNYFSINAIDFYYYKDDDSYNAFAYYTGEGEEMNEIYFGEDLINEFKKKFGDSYKFAISAVIAHELAHAKQYALNGIDFPVNDPFQQELHADFMAGYFIGYRYSIDMASQNEANAFFETFYDMGDTNFSSTTHHGTSEQRKRASVEGWEYGKKLFSVIDAYQRGISVVKNYVRQEK